jgi:hypothetical protein
MEPAEKPFPPIRSCALDAVTWSTCLLGFQFALDYGMISEIRPAVMTPWQRPVRIPLQTRACGDRAQSREEITQPSMEADLRSYEALSSTRD